MHMHNLHTLVHVTLFESVSPFLTLTLNTFLEASSNSSWDLHIFLPPKCRDLFTQFRSSLCSHLCVLCAFFRRETWSCSCSRFCPHRWCMWRQSYMRRPPHLELLLHGCTNYFEWTPEGHLLVFCSVFVWHAQLCVFYHFTKSASQLWGWTSEKVC